MLIEIEVFFDFVLVFWLNSKVNGIEEVENPVLMGMLTDEPEGST